jgi:8-oxo-dGTP pyrophosphatase MutT (NUDIX family)
MAQSDASFPFTFADTLASYAVSPKTWHIRHGNRYNGIVASAIVFDSQGRLLLLRRALKDFLPGLWEPAGGAVEAKDATVLHGCTRELMEEAGLVAQRIDGIVGEGFDFGDHGEVWRRITFLAYAGEDGQVKTDPEEHSEWKWATEKEVIDEKMEDGREMPITFPEVKKTLLDAFRLSRGNKDAAITAGSV